MLVHDNYQDIDKKKKKMFIPFFSKKADSVLGAIEVLGREEGAVKDARKWHRKVLKETGMEKEESLEREGSGGKDDSVGKEDSVGKDDNVGKDDSEGMKESEEKEDSVGKNNGRRGGVNRRGVVGKKNDSEKQERDSMDPHIILTTQPKHRLCSEAGCHMKVRHMKRHKWEHHRIGDEPKFPCPHCDKSSDRKSDRERHIRTCKK